VSLAATPTQPALTAIPLPLPAGARPGSSLPALGGDSPAEPQAYSLLLPSKSGALFLQHGRSLVLPLFSGWNEAATFLVQARLTRCWIIELPTAEVVADFLRNPPGRSLQSEFLVSVDPIDLMNLTAQMFSAREVIKALVRGRQ
jgi:hypothetical protein